MAGQTGDALTFGNAPSDLTPYDFFLYTFPLEYLPVIVRLTKKEMENKPYRPVTPGEILKFFGTLVLVKKFSFSNRRDLWRTKPYSKYVSLPDFGR